MLSRKRRSYTFFIESPTKKPPVVTTGGFGKPLAAYAVEEALELPASDRMLQLADGLGLDLADAFARDLEDAAHLFERVGVAIAQAIAQLDDLALAVGQGLEHVVDLVLEHFLGGGADRRFDAVVL